MPQQPFMPAPGVNTEASPLLLASGWSQSSLIRFLNNLLQKTGGCQRLTSSTFTGVARCLKAFADLTGLIYIGIATTNRLQLLNNGQIYDITPVRATDNLTNAFSVTAGSSTVTILDSEATLLIGDWINITTAVGLSTNLLLQGFYEVTGIVSGGYEINVAPLVAATTVTNGGSVPTYITTNGQHLIQVTVGTYGAFTAGQNWLVYNPVTVGGLTLSGSYIISLSGGNAYITSIDPATSSASATENGGQEQINYLLESSTEGSQLIGYGSGLYGEGPYGITNPSPAASPIRVWSEDNWGQDLVACLRGGKIYVWIPPISYDNPAVVIGASSTGSGAPPFNNGIFVAMPQEQLVAFGTTDSTTGQQDPMLVGWSDVADYTDWTPSATNQAGSFRLSNGSRIVAGIQGPQQALLWTDLDLWVMQYIGYPYVYGFQRVGWACGPISQRSVAAAGPNVIWPGNETFFIFNGEYVSPLPCTVWDVFYNNLDPAYVDLIFAAANSDFNEIAWHFPTMGSNGQITTYVNFNYQTNVWDYGSDPGYARTAWTDRSIFGAPIGSDYNGLLQQHEQQYTSLDGGVMNSWALSGWISLAEGSEYIFLNKLLPDFVLGPGSTVLITIYVVDFMGDQERMYGPYTVTENTDYLVVRARGRYARVMVQSNDRNSFWRLGRLESQISPAGRR